MKENTYFNKIQEQRNFNKIRISPCKNIYFQRFKFKYCVSLILNLVKH